MPQHRLIRNLLFGGLGLIAGFLALAVAVPLEAEMPVPLLVLLSPGLKIAELIIPDTHGSLAWTFGRFLSVGVYRDSEARPPTASSCLSIEAYTEGPGVAGKTAHAR